MTRFTWTADGMQADPNGEYVQYIPPHQWLIHRRGEQPAPDGAEMTVRLKDGTKLECLAGQVDWSLSVDNPVTQYLFR